MSKLLGNAMSKLIAALTVLLFAAALRDSIVTNDGIGEMFGALMANLPFSNLFVDVICKLMKFNYQLPEISGASVGTDILKLLIMACVQPLLVGLLSMVFLRLPSGLSVDDSEGFMSRPGYRIRETLIAVISAPFLALFAANAAAWVFEFFADRFSGFTAGLLRIISVIGVGGISLTPLLISGTALGTALAWRLLVTVGGNVVGTIVTNAICLWLYVAVLGGISQQIIYAVLALIGWMIVFELGINCLRFAVAGK